MPDHKFRLGQKVRLNRGYPYRLVSEGAYEIVRRMPDSDGEYSYRIKNAGEAHERVAKESEIENAWGGPALSRDPRAKASPNRIGRRRAARSIVPMRGISGSPRRRSRQFFQIAQHGGAGFRHGGVGRVAARHLGPATLLDEGALLPRADLLELGHVGGGVGATLEPVDADGREGRHQRRDRA